MKFKLVENINGGHDDVSSNEIIVYNGINQKDFNYNTINLNNSNEIGLHCGTYTAAKNRGYKYVNKLTIHNINSFHIDADIPHWASYELLRYLTTLLTPMEISKLQNDMRKTSVGESMYRERSTLIRQALLNKGINVLTYTNGREDPGSISYIILDKEVIK